MKPPHSIDSLVRDSAGEKRIRRLPAWLVPAAIFCGFMLLFAALFGDRILPGKPVNVALVLATAPGSSAPVESAVTSTAGEPRFQASGWIEPDPLPVRATALVDGVIESVRVLEGQKISRGEEIARLIDEDVLLEVEAAKNMHRKMMSAKSAHVASIQTAHRKLDAAKAQVESAQTLRDEALDQLKRMQSLSRDVIPESEVVSARLRLAREEAASAAAAAAAGEWQAEIARLDLETKVTEDEIAAAAIALKQAELAQARTRIVSPLDGRVLRLMAAPGQKKMRSDNDAESATVAILYDPRKLQVRVDVPLADAAGLQLSQKVRIHCSLLPDRTFPGEVTRISGEADFQRNTLQAKVRIDDPVDELRPEMLCRVEFMDAGTLATGHGSNAVPGSGTLRMWIPEASFADGRVWVVDPESKRVSNRPVTPAGERMDNFLRIRDGLRPGEWVVISPSGLHENQRVKPTHISNLSSP